MTLHDFSIADLDAIGRALADPAIGTRSHRLLEGSVRTRRLWVESIRTAGGLSLELGRILDGLGLPFALSAKPCGLEAVGTGGRR